MLKTQNVEYFSLYSLIEQTEKSSSQGFFIPSFQRPYAWEWNEQIIKLFSDLLLSSLRNLKQCLPTDSTQETFIKKNFSDDKPNVLLTEYLKEVVPNAYNLGMMYYYPSNESIKTYSVLKTEDEYHLASTGKDQKQVCIVIDGQQRITTMLLIARAIYNIIKDYNNSTHTEPTNQSLFQRTLDDLGKCISAGTNLDSDGLIADGNHSTLTISSVHKENSIVLEYIQRIGSLPKHDDHLFSDCKQVNLSNNSYAKVFRNFIDLLSPHEDFKKIKTRKVELKELYKLCKKLLWTPTSEVAKLLSDQDVRVDNDLIELAAYKDNLQTNTSCKYPFIVYVALNLIHNLHLVVRKSGDRASATKSFVSINSTGLKLETEDIIKVRLFTLLSPHQDVNNGQHANVLNRTEFITRWQKINNEVKALEGLNKLSYLLDPVSFYHTLKQYAGDKEKVDTGFEGLNIVNFFKKKFNAEEIESFLKQAEFNQELQKFIYASDENTKQTIFGKVTPEVVKLQNLLFAIVNVQEQYSCASLFVYFWKQALDNPKNRNKKSGYDFELPADKIQDSLRFAQKHLANMLLNFCLTRKKDLSRYRAVQTAVNILGPNKYNSEYKYFDDYAFPSMCYINATEDKFPKGDVKNDKEISLSKVISKEDFSELRFGKNFFAVILEVISRFTTHPLGDACEHFKYKDGFKFTSKDFFHLNNKDEKKKSEVEHIAAKAGPRDKSDEEAYELKKVSETIGNKIILPKSVNSKISNKSFSEKRKQYANTLYCLPQFVSSKYEQFGIKEITDFSEVLYEVVSQYISESNALYYEKPYVGNIPTEKFNLDEWLQEHKA